MNEDTMYIPEGSALAAALAALEQRAAAHTPPLKVSRWSFHPAGRRKSTLKTWEVIYAVHAGPKAATFRQQTQLWDYEAIRGLKYPGEDPGAGRPAHNAILALLDRADEWSDTPLYVDDGAAEAVARHVKATSFVDLRREPTVVEWLEGVLKANRHQKGVAIPVSYARLTDLLTAAKTVSLKTVWIAYNGQYADYGVRCIFSTEEKAQAWLTWAKENGVEYPGIGPMILDAETEHLEKKSD